MSSAFLKGPGGIILVSVLAVVSVERSVAAWRHKAQSQDWAQKAQDRQEQLDALKKTAALRPTEVSSELDGAALARAEADAQRIRDLEEDLAQKDPALLAMTDSNNTEVVANEPRREERRDPRNMLARLKEEDPERYQQIQEFRKKAEVTMTQNIGEQVSFLAEMDMSALGPEFQANHNELVTRLTNLQQKIADASAAGEDADLRSMGREIFHEMRDMRDMMETERQALLYDAAAQAGYKDEAAWEYVDYIEYVNQMTSSRSIMRGMDIGGMMGGRGGGRSGGGRSGQSGGGDR